MVVNRLSIRPRQPRLSAQFSASTDGTNPGVLVSCGWLVIEYCLKYSSALSGPPLGQLRNRAAIAGIDNAEPAQSRGHGASCHLELFWSFSPGRRGAA